MTPQPQSRPEAWRLGMSRYYREHPAGLHRITFRVRGHTDEERPLVHENGKRVELLRVLPKR